MTIEKGWKLFTGLASLFWKIYNWFIRQRV